MLLDTVSAMRETEVNPEYAFEIAAEILMG